MFDMLGIGNLFNFAYLDPGTGSLIIQSVIGVVAGVSVFGRNAIAKVTHKAKQAFNKQQVNEAEAKTD